MITADEIFDEPDYDNDDDESIWDDPDMYPGPDPDGEDNE